MKLLPAKYKLLAATLAFLGLPASVNATTISYDFDSNHIGTFSNNQTFTGSDGSTLTATAFATTDDGQNLEARLGAAAGYGLYVCSDTDADGINDFSSIFTPNCGFDSYWSPEDIYPIDGEDNINEGVLLDFAGDAEYQLLNASFFVYDSWFGDHDDIGNGAQVFAESLFIGTALFRDNANSISDCTESRSSGNLGWNFDCSFSNPVTASDFSFVAGEDVHKFKLKGITVASVAVPEPGTLALFGIGIVGLGLCRRRRV